MAEDENTIDTTEKKEVKIEIKRKQEEKDMKEQEEKSNLGEKRQRDWDSKIVRKKKKKVVPYYVPVPYEILQVPNEVIQSQQAQSQQVQSQQVQNQQVQSQQVQSQQVQSQQVQNQQAQNQQAQRLAQRRLRQSNHGESPNPPQPPNKEVTPESDILSTTMHGLIETAKSDVSRSLFLRACCLLGFMLMASVAIAHGILRKNAVSCDVFVMLIFLFLFNLLSLPNAKK